MKKLLLLSSFLFFLSPISLMQAEPWGAPCNRSTGPYCPDPFECSNNICICPGTSVHATSTIGAIGCKPPVVKYSGWDQPISHEARQCDTPYLPQGDYCYCPGASCHDPNDSSSTTPCIPCPLGAKTKKH